LRGLILCVCNSVFKTFFLVDPFWLRKVTTNPYIHAHFSIEYPDDGYPKLKTCISEVILDSYEYIPVAYVTMYCWLHGYWKFRNPLTPNDHYSGRTAPLTSKPCVLHIYSTNIGTEYFEHGIYSPFFSLQNAVCFILLTYLVPVLFTFYIQVVLKFKKK